jgi:long-subunit acyl-CoA synthetase (AMP-forming)
MTETSPSASHTFFGNTNYDSVGVPISNTELKIVDAETRTDLPQGEMGEICIRGPQVRNKSSRLISEPDGPVCMNEI